MGVGWGCGLLVILFKSSKIKRQSHRETQRQALVSRVSHTIAQRTMPGHKVMLIFTRILYCAGISCAIISTKNVRNYISLILLKHNKCNQHMINPTVYITLTRSKTTSFKNSYKDNSKFYERIYLITH